ncbi:catalase [Halyomorpha halys]|uniref:catalase n=1 Tax=Halyomorpha halys TaxID=286706 RepID=UPI0006D50CEA|nr:catalase [Halyomorpha halys]XP_024216621.1 catalase [Halyomorpha halys]
MGFGPDNPASLQLLMFAQNNPIPANYTTSSGNPVAYPATVLTAGPNGPMLIQDTSFINEFQHFDRERIPERVVHAKGTGAMGTFTVTSTEITNFSAASLFNQVGKTTPLFIRFSQVAGESGSADTVRDARGFAVKFYTEEGNWDLVGLNLPVFWIRDPLLFPSFVHSQKRNPVTHLRDWNMYWDFISLMPETTLMSMFVHSDLGIPQNYRSMNGFGPNTFSLVNNQGEYVFCKFHMISNQGIANMDPITATQMAGVDPDYYIRDLFNSISLGNFPSWNLSVQIMTPSQVEGFAWNPFDATKLWPLKGYPLIPVGIITLDQNSDNYFDQVEQAGFDPQRLIPGIETSPDKLLQGRLFSYTDTHMHRLGVNNELIKVNAPLQTAKVANRQRDGYARTDNNQDGSPNYYPNSFNGPIGNPRGKQALYPVSGMVAAYDTSNEDNFSQATWFWNQLTSDQRSRLVANIAATLNYAAPFIQERAVNNYLQVSEDFGNAIAAGLGNSSGTK